MRSREKWIYLNIHVSYHAHKTSNRKFIGKSNPVSWEVENGRKSDRDPVRTSIMVVGLSWPRHLGKPEGRFWR